MQAAGSKKSVYTIRSTDIVFANDQADWTWSWTTAVDSRLGRIKNLSITDTLPGNQVPAKLRSMTIITCGVLFPQMQLIVPSFGRPLTLI